MKRLTIIAGLLLVALFLTSIAVNAQAKAHKDAKGNYTAFTTPKDSTATHSTYTDSKGKVYPVYSTKAGKLFAPSYTKTGVYRRKYIKVVS